MSDLASIRETLAKVDRERTLERAAESARTTIRLNGTLVARKGLLGFMRGKASQDSFFTSAETTAIYEALAVVREEARMRAAQLEATIGEPS